MPSPGEDIQAWSVTAGNNGTSDPLINWAEGQARASVNNSSRSEMAAHAKNRNLINGSIVTTGTANAQQFLSGLTYTTIPTNLVVQLKIGSGLTNTASTTLNMDGLGDTIIKTADGLDIKGGELVGDGYASLLYNGTNWIFLYGREFFWNAINGGGGIIVGKQIFTASGTYTPTPGMACCIIECVGGGGGGGAASTSAGNEYMTGGGGGGGAYARKLAQAADIGATQAVTVGTGGTGSGGGGGGAGGTSSLGTLCVAPGGGGGGDGFNGNISFGGSGGTGGTGDVVSAGGAGGPGFYNFGLTTNVYGRAGSGGSSVLGGGGHGLAPGLNGGGAGGGNYGGGAGGSSSYAGAGLAGGSFGGPGVVIITEFAGRGAPGRDGADGADGPQGPVGPPGPAGAGTGDVLVSGTPAAGQLARWTDTSHIQGVDAAAFVFTTGDAKITLKTTADSGWVMMNDGTIGNIGSGASTRANTDTNALFTLLFNNIADAWAPILTSAGAATTRAAQTNAGAAWIANCRMTLPRQLGRSIAVAGTGTALTARPLGAYVGEENHQLTIAELASHTHSIASTTPFPGYAAGNDLNLVGSAATGAAGSDVPHNTMQPTSFWNVMIKL